MKPINYYLPLLAVLLLWIAQSMQGQQIAKADNEPYVPVSIIELIANPEHFDGRKVKVMGIYCADHPNEWLFQSKEAYLAFDTASAIFLSRRDSRIGDTDKKWSGRSAYVDGVFKFAKKGREKYIESINNIWIVERGSPSKE